MAPPPAAPPLAPAGPSAEPPRRRGRSVRNVAIATVTAGALALVGVGVASAQSSGTTTTTPSTVAPSTTSPTPKPAAGPRGLSGKGFPGPGGPGGLDGFGPGGTIRGEFVRPNGSGGYQTVDTQTGVVQAGVSNTSIAVKSADGVTKTYSVTTNTVVNSGRDGIGSVKAGDTVEIEAVVPASGGTPEAASIVDRTSLGSIQGHWKPQRPATPSTPPTTTG